MKETDDKFDEDEESEDQSKLALTIIGVMCVIGLIIGIYVNPRVEPTMTIEMPDPPPIQKAQNFIVDSVYAVYLLKNDSIALYTTDTLLFTTLTAAFSDTSLVNTMRDEIVLIKQTNHSDYTTLTRALDNSNFYGLKKFIIASYHNGELDTLRKRYSK